MGIRSKVWAKTGLRRASVALLVEVTRAGSVRKGVGRLGGALLLLKVVPLLNVRSRFGKYSNVKRVRAGESEHGVVIARVIDPVDGHKAYVCGLRMNECQRDERHSKL